MNEIVTRKNTTPIKVYCLPDEKEMIAENAKAVGMSVARYLRVIGIGYEPRSIIDHQRVNELLKINGDLGRLGGLLKLWLTDDARTADFSASTILAVLGRIEETQAMMKEIMRSVVMPRDGRLPE
jgi:hypothetical protein